MTTSNVKRQKALGRKVRGFIESVWLEHREGIVFRGNVLKFSQNPGLLQKLDETGNRPLVEASPLDRSARLQHVLCSLLPPLVSNKHVTISPFHLPR